LGGDWVLEAQSGVVEATATAIATDAFSSLLAAPALYTGMGGATDFGENVYAAADDGYFPAIDITPVFGALGVQFGTKFYTSIYVDNNGMVTFGAGYSGFDATGLVYGVKDEGDGVTLIPAIAAFWTDLDTQGTTTTSAGGTSQGTNRVYWDLDAENKRVTITWDDVGEFSLGSLPVAAFQIRLTDAGSGNMDFEIRYENTQSMVNHTASAGWNTGVVGVNSGTDYFEISGGSGTVAYADLATTAGNSLQDGVWVFGLRAGAVVTPDPETGVVTTNAAPSITAASQSGTEDNSITLTAADFTGHYSDAESDALAKIMITSLPANGTLYLSGNAVAVNQEITLADLGNLTFTPTEKYNGSTAFNWKANDGSSYSTPTTFTFTITGTNDAPVFDSTAGAATITETSAYDITLTAASGSLTGTLAAADVDSTLTGTAAFGVRGGSISGNTVTKVGLYGVLTLDSYTGVWSYAPDNLEAINALPTGTTVHDSFDFKVVDPAGAFSTQMLDITINGANDAPLLAATIADQSFSGSGFWICQIPAGSFTDAEGTGLTCTVQVVDGNGALVGNGTLEANTSWLSFDEATRTFTGNPPAGSSDIYLKVTATDDHAASASDIFLLDLTAPLNDLPSGSVTITNTTDSGRGTTTLQQGDLLTAGNTLTDPDGPSPITGLTYHWFANGSEIGTGETFALIQAEVGKVITVVAGYSDSGSTAESAASIQTSPVVNVNDAPTSTAESITILEEHYHVLTLQDFGSYDDADGTPLAAVQMTTLPANGTLYYNNVAVSDVVTLLNVARADIEAGLLKFVPTANFDTASGADHIDFKVGDGTAFSASDYVLTLNVT
ncbi:MAG: VCBS domain-containing protein, partial [Chlorobium sp.]